MSSQPVINSVDDIARLSRPSIKVYNPDDEPDTVELGGHFFNFPARGECVIGDQMDYPMARTPAGMRRNFEANRVLASEEGCDAVGMAKRMVSSEIRGLKGFCILLGDGRDDQRKEQARRINMAWRHEQAKALQVHWLQQVAMATAEPGTIAPVMPLPVRRAIEFLRLHESGRLGRKQFICRLDGAEFDLRAEAAAYIKQMYPGTDVEANIQDVKAGVQPEAPKASAVDYMLTRATELGISLSVADQKGLRFGDEDVVRDVSARLSAAEVAAARVAAPIKKEAPRG